MNLRLLRSPTPTSGDFQDVEAVAGMAAAFRPGLLVCVTVYNEGLGPVTATLASLLNSLRQVQGSGPAHGNACIALMIDGPEKADAQVLRFLRRSGMLVREAQSEGGQTRFFFSRRPARALAWRSAGSAVRCDDPRECSFVVCMKDRNRGKLHSHALFFGNLCARLEPRYCFQIDAGTTVAPPAVGAMLAHFERVPAAGALASRVVSSAPAAGDSLLANWQFMDFATQAAVSWPAEVATGHLSVLPGQFCGLRWEALACGSPRRPLVNEAELAQACDGDAARDPLGRYLRGLAAQTPMERIMFLAEDRIIGNELLLGARPWRLEFCTQAHATTDACESLPELLRQRRRWNNSASACRLWLLGQWPAFLGRADRSIAAKLRFSMAMAWQLVLLLQQLLVPASLVCSVLLVAQAALAAQARGQWWPSLLLLAALAAGLCGALAPAGRGRSRWRPVMRDAGFLGTLGAVAWLLAGHIPAVSVAMVFAPVLAITALSVLALRTRRLAVLRRAAEYFIVVNPFMQVGLWAYAIARLNDLSWGTKGLTGAPQGVRGWGLPAAALGLWAALNGTVVWLAATVPAWWFAGLNPVLEVMTGLLAVATGLALWPRRGVKPRGRPMPARDLQGAGAAAPAVQPQGLHRA